MPMWTQCSGVRSPAPAQKHAHCDTDPHNTTQSLLASLHKSTTQGFISVRQGLRESTAQGLAQHPPL